MSVEGRVDKRMGVSDFPECLFCVSRFDDKDMFEVHP